MQNNQQSQTPNQTPNLNPNLDENQRDLEGPPNQNATNLNALNRMREEQGGQVSAQGQSAQDQSDQGQGVSGQAPLEQGRQGRQLSQEEMERNERGLPGGGVGRMDTPGRTGIYPVSADQGASGDAPLQGEEAFGQGDRGEAGYEDSGGSEVIPPNELGKGDKEVI